MGVSKELKPRYDKCVKKVMANGGKKQTEAESICELSLTSMKPAPVPKPKPEMVIANVEKDTHYVFASSSKINSASEGKIIKDVEIFKAGTFKGIEFKQSALEKMVANFYVLKAHDTFAHVPVRSDHPGWLGEVGVIDRVGGYVKDLRVVGKKLVADIRVTSESMLQKILEGSYISRSAEIGNYRDNNGDTFSPVLWGFAWVDIPAVEGLSPTFSFSKENNVELVKLNEEDNMAKVNLEAEIPVETTATEEKDEQVAPAGEPVEVKVVVDAPAEVPIEVVVEAPAEVPVEVVPTEETTEVVPPVVESATEAPSITESKFAKDFPKEFAELQKLKKDKIDGKVSIYVKEGKVLPAQREAVNAFVNGLSDEQFNALDAILNEMPALVKLNEEQAEVGSETQVTPETAKAEESAEAKADKFLDETK